jgi:hypothetical protein
MMEDGVPMSVFLREEYMSQFGGDCGAEGTVILTKRWDKRD